MSSISVSVTHSPTQSDLTICLTAWRDYCGGGDCPRPGFRNCVSCIVRSMACFIDDGDAALCGKSGYTPISAGGFTDSLFANIEL